MLRDTDTDWTLIASHQPFFGVLANEQYLTENLTPQAIDEFYMSGEADIAHVVATLARVSGAEIAPKRAIDFGCGVGRLTLAMAKYAESVVGLDVSEPMLTVGREQVEARGVGNVELTSTMPDGPVDWVSSLIVFQHIPPERGYEIVSTLVDKLSPGGFLSIQLTFFRDARHVGEVTRDLADYRYDGQTVQLLSIADSEVGGMSMYDYDLNRIFRILFLGGIESVTAEHTDHAGCHGTWLFGRKSDSAAA